MTTISATVARAGYSALFDGPPRRCECCSAARGRIVAAYQHVNVIGNQRPRIAITCDSKYCRARGRAAVGLEPA